MDTLKHHHIKFKQGPNQDGVAEWELELKKLKGISQVRIDMEKRDVFVEYDLLKCKEANIERWLVIDILLAERPLRE